MSFREDILAAIEDVRSLPGELDIRQYRVFVVVRTWDGPRLGLGTATTTETEILVSGYPPRVRDLKEKEVSSRGSPYVVGDLRVGPITPDHATGGVAPAVLTKDAVSLKTETAFRVEGPGLDAGGVWCRRVADATLGNFSNYVVLRRSEKPLT